MGLFIPKKIRVGFQKRTDTFTGQLAYIIYYDEKGKIRKEASFEGWRDHSIATLELDNEPRAGFVINKGVQRDGYWGSGRSVARIHDDRNFEFEISVTNLMGILMHSDVSKRDIAEKCVYAWNGTELVLLPCNSQEFIKAQEFTANQDIKLSGKDLILGATYKQKKSEYCDFIYMGHMPWEGPEKKHVFWVPQYKAAESKTPDTLILENETCHEKFAEWLVKTQSSQKVDVQALSPKLMKLGGVYRHEKYAYGKGKTGRSVVYMGTHLFPQQVDGSRMHYVADDFKKRPVFFVISENKFETIALKDLDVNLNPSLSDNYSDLVAHFEKTCPVGAPLQYVTDPITLQAENLAQHVWLKSEKDKQYTKYLLSKDAEKYVLTPQWLVSLMYGGLSDYTYDLTQTYGRRDDLTKRITVSSLEEVQALNPCVLNLQDPTGKKIERMDLYKSFKK